MNDLTTPAPGKLGDIMTAHAKIAMPEVVSVFISKYETELYDSKKRLQKEISDTKSDLELLENSASQLADFSKYAGDKLPLFKLVTYVKDNIDVNWTTSTFTGVIGLQTPAKGKEPAKPDGSFHKEVFQKIPAATIKQRSKLQDTVSRVQGELSTIISLIGDMSRKERQVKARISEMRLEEQGLEGFLNDPEMQKMISLDHQV